MKKKKVLKIQPKTIIRFYANAAKRSQNKVRILRAALNDLLRLKRLKDAQGKTIEYKHQMPHAWRVAEEVLAKTAPKKLLGVKIPKMFNNDEHTRQW